MCLTIPYKVLSCRDKTAIVIFNNKKQKVNSNLINVKKGDYVIIQNKIIIKKINKKEANKIFTLLKEVKL